MSVQNIEAPLDRDSFLYEIIWQKVRSPLVLKAFSKVDRKDFVPEEYKDKAYVNKVIELGNGSSISKPSLVADMIDHLGLKGKERVLEVGTGSGYSAAVLSYCSGEVYSIENNLYLAESAEKRLRHLGIGNVEVFTGDGLLGLPHLAPFDHIIIHGALRSSPLILMDQLRKGGRIEAPIGPDPQHLALIVSVKIPKGFKGKDVDRVNFHPIMSPEAGGWTEEDLRKILDIKRYFIKGWGEKNNLYGDEALIGYAETISDLEVSREDLKDPQKEEVLIRLLPIPPQAYFAVEKLLDEEKQKQIPDFNLTT